LALWGRPRGLERVGLRSIIPQPMRLPARELLSAQCPYATSP
jgi:hypothetical protein